MNNTNESPLVLSTRTVSEIVGFDAAKLLITIDHAVLEFGRDWRMSPAGQVYTVNGLTRIAAELVVRGHPGAGEKLRTALINALSSARAEGPAPVGPLVSVARVADASEEQLEEAVATVKRYRTEEASPFVGEE